MIVISNNVQGTLPLPEDVVIRVNAAWVSNKAELIQIVERNISKLIYLDFPEGRSKPPKPTVTESEVLDVAITYDNVKYFAVSNAEGFSQMERYRKLLPDRVKIVPKIESPVGVLKILAIVQGAKTDTIMLDKEDLYTSVKTDPKQFETYVNVLRSMCKSHNIQVLELQGVIFYAR